LLGLTRVRVNYPDLKRLVIDQAVRFNVSTIIIEDAGSGTALIQELARERYSGVPKPIAIRPDGNKVTRMSTASAQIENGQVFLPRKADFLEDLRLELLQFPYGRHDDQADSISQFLNWIARRNRSRAIVREMPW
jgi:predicted phage terminase large subunit-like protein